jgi:hypothetical protein
MFRSTLVVAIFALLLGSTAVPAQDGAAVQGYFDGKQVVLKIAMPGSQKGVDLRFNNPLRIYGGCRAKNSSRAVCHE